MNRWTKSGSRLGAAAFALAAGAAMACETPTMIHVPDAETATMDEMVTANQQVKDYVAAMDEYLACIDEEIAAAGEDAPPEFQTLMITRYNAAVTEMERVAAAFNEQVRAYKALHPEED